MGPVESRSGITLEKAQNRMGITPGDDELVDEILEEQLQAVLEVADQYLNNPFIDSDGADVAIPAAVKRGVWKMLELERLERAMEGVKAFKEGDVSITYEDKEQRRVELMTNYWSKFCLSPGL